MTDHLVTAETHKAMRQTPLLPGMPQTIIELAKQLGG